jgi:hypothetical protein
MAQAKEQDFPPGHPARFDYDPKSADAIEWSRQNQFPEGEPAYLPDHPAAGAHENPRNAVEWRAGVDPERPDHEAFTGRSPVYAAAVAEHNAELAKRAKESPALEPVLAPDPPPPQP